MNLKSTATDGFNFLTMISLMESWGVCVQYNIRIQATD